MHGLDGHKVTRVSCGSSHSIAWEELNVAPQILFEPIQISGGKDPLGSAYVTNEFEKMKQKEDLGQHIRRQRPSLSRDVLLLASNEDKQKALSLILDALRVAYARDILIKMLSDLSSTSASTSGSACFSEKFSDVDPNSKKSDSMNGDKKRASLTCETLSLSQSKVKLLMSLLKIGFAGRLQVEQCQALCKVLIDAAKKDKEVFIAFLQ